MRWSATDRPVFSRSEARMRHLSSATSSSSSRTHSRSSARTYSPGSWGREGWAEWRRASLFVYAPWKLAQNGHLHAISSGGIPLALFLLVRGYRRRSAALVLGGWLVGAWQMTLGFTLGLQLAYLLAVLGAIGAFALLRRRFWPFDRRVIGATALGLVVFVVAAALMSRPYLRVIDAHPEARRTPEYVESFSRELRSVLAAPEQSWLWADASYRARASLAAPDEMSLFPGLTISLLALVGVIASVYASGSGSGLPLVSSSAHTWP